MKYLSHLCFLDLLLAAKRKKQYQSESLPLYFLAGICAKYA